MFGGAGFEFGDEVFDVESVGVKFLALKDGVEDAKEWSGVSTAAGDPLPIHSVCSEVSVNEKFPEVFFADLPGLEEVFDEEGGGDHADAVVHSACLGELAHAGVDDGVAGFTFFPGFEAGVVVFPGKFEEGLAKGCCLHIGEMDEEVGCEFTPKEFLFKSMGSEGS